MSNKKNQKVSASILTKNNESCIRNALESVKWADEIVIADGFSTDKTLDICKTYGCKIYQKKFEGFDKERNFAISKCSHPWVFELDSDEVIDAKMKQSILLAVKSKTYGAYFIKRKEYFMKRYLFDLKLIRLHKKGVLHYLGMTHEQVRFDRKVNIGMLKGYCYHHPDDMDTLFQSVNKWDVETERELVSAARFPKGKISRLHLYYGMLAKPWVHFFGLLFYKGFIFKGMHAIIWAAGNAFYEFSVYAKYYEVHVLNVRKIDESKMVHKTSPSQQRK